MRFNSKIMFASLCLGLFLTAIHPSNAQTTADANKGLADSIQVKAPAKLICSLYGEGVQIYKCTLKNGAFVWDFVGPEAILKDAKGKKVGTHGIGPFWAYNDGSRIEATKLKDSPAKYPNSIPFLLLQGKNPSGKGKFSEVSMIQRVDTKGGKAPTTPCGKGNEGTIERVKYTATYNFYKAK